MLSLTFRLLSWFRQVGRVGKIGVLSLILCLMYKYILYVQISVLSLILCLMYKYMLHVQISVLSLTLY